MKYAKTSIESHKKFLRVYKKATVAIMELDYQASIKSKILHYIYIYIYIYKESNYPFHLPFPFENIFRMK